MTLLRNDLNDAANGSNIQTSDPGDPNPFNTITTTGGTLVRDSSIGSVAMWAKATLSSTADCLMQWSLTASNKMASHAYFYCTAYPSASIRIMGLTTATPTTYYGLALSSGGLLSIQNNAGATLFTSVGALSLSTPYRIEISHDNTGGTAAGISNLNTYSFGSGTPIANLSTALTGTATGAGTLARAYFGRSAGTPTTGTFWWGDLAAQDGVTTEIGQYVPPAVAMSWAHTVNQG